MQDPCNANPVVQGPFALRFPNRLAHAQRWAGGAYPMSTQCWLFKYPSEATTTCKHTLLTFILPYNHADEHRGTVGSWRTGKCSTHYQHVETHTCHSLEPRHCPPGIPQITIKQPKENRSTYSMARRSTRIRRIHSLPTS